MLGLDTKAFLHYNVSYDFSHLVLNALSQPVSASFHAVSSVDIQKHIANQLMVTNKSLTLKHLEVSSVEISPQVHLSQWITLNPD